MRDWHRFWTEHPKSVDEEDFLSQVCHTLSGRPLDATEFAAMVEAMRLPLALTGEQRLLDLCCGNGMVTRELARGCRDVVAIDFSEVLLEKARRHHAASNIRYQLGDVLQLDRMVLGGPFDRFNMHVSLQHLQPAHFRPLLASVIAHATERFVFLACGILDLRRKDAYLDTPEKRALNAELVRKGEDRLGTWWDPNVIVSQCEDVGLACRIDSGSPGRINPDFRFDAIISR